MSKARAESDVFTTLGEVVGRTGGALQTGPFGSQLHASDYVMMGTPLVMPVNLGDNEIRETGIARVAGKDARRLRRHALREGDIIFSRRGDVGRRSIVRTAQVGWLCGTGCLAARFGRERDEVNPTYVAHFLGSTAAQTWLQDNAVGGTMPNLNTGILAALPIRLPARAEQDEIVEALDDATSQIRVIERLISKKQAIKHGMMQQLLTGKTRLAGFSSTAMRVTEIGEIPTEWSIVPLAMLVDPRRPIRYGIVQPGDYDANGRYMIRGQDYSEAKGWAAPGDVFRVSPRVELRYRNARVQPGDLIMTIVGYAGHVEMVPAWLAGANLTQTTARIAVKSEQAVASFCKYVLQSQIGKRQVAAYLKGAAQPGLNIGDVAKLLICLPPVEEQVAVATVLVDTDNEIDVLKRRLAKAKATKQGMMQVLLPARPSLPLTKAV